MNSQSDTMHSVKLNFPNARLYMQNLLAVENLTGGEAIAKAACEYGLIDQEAARTIITRVEGTGCQCMGTAKAILEKYFEGREHRPYLINDDSNVVWDSFLNEIRHFQRRNQMPAEDSHGDGKASECQKFAPILIDLLLQHIRRYP
jgi:hypothetical protein